MAESIITEELCNWGCGRTALFYFPYSKKVCCGSNVSKCPAKTARVVSKLRESGMYAKNAEKAYLTKKNTITSNGLSILENSIVKFKQTISAVNDSGSTIAQERAKKMVHTRMNTIDPQTGMNICKSSGVKQAITKTNDVDDNGMNMHKRAGVLGGKSRRLVDSAGMNFYDRTNPTRIAKCRDSSNRLHQARLLDIDDTGGDHYTRRTERMLADVDDTGLNAIERAQKNMRKSSVRCKYKTTELYYQCSHELKFLEKLELEHGLSWIMANVQNGVYIRYWSPVASADRYYIPDFLIGNQLYEIKSAYTWDDYGTNTDLLAVNLAKLTTSEQRGYEVHLILDGVDTKWN